MPLVVLAMLEDRPDHPWGVLQRITERFGDSYAPSPGTVYPAVSALAQRGLIDGARQGRRTVYALTRSGRATLEAHRGDLSALEARIGKSVGLSNDLDRAFVRLRAAIAETTRREGAGVAVAAIEAAIRRLEQSRPAAANVARA
ncbi:MAG TPA: PadR family transcriptional regulator [Acidimicrobiales bacterium]|nr:PadR family transcriptional regulator [Acidimicrobiales bacterium]